MRSRDTWLAFATSLAFALFAGAAMVLALSAHDSRLLSSGGLLLELGAASLWGAIIIAAPMAPEHQMGLAQVRLGSGLAAAGLTATAVSIDPTEIGWLQLALLVASLLLVPVILGSPWLVRRGRADRLARRLGTWGTRTPLDLAEATTERGELLSGLAIVAAGAMAFFWLVSSDTLGHDESVYALKARAWREGTPTSGFNIYRPIGLPVVGWFVLASGSAEAGLRAFGAAASVVLVAMVWRTGRALLSPIVGVTAALLLIGAPSFLRRSAEFLNDVASTALLVAIIVLLWRHFEEKGTNRWQVILVGPVAAAAFYIRYGVATAYLAILVVAGILWRRRLRASLAPLLAAAGVLLALLLPHLVYATNTTGSPLGILEAASKVVGRDYLGQGLASYLRWLPDKLAGPVLGRMIALGSITTAVAVIGHGLRNERQRRGAILLGGVGMGHLVLLGLFAHAEERFVFLSIALLGLVGVHVVLTGWARLAPLLRRVTGAGAVLAVAFLTVVNILEAHDHLGDLAASRAVIHETADAIADVADPNDCVVMTSYLPQITWYTECTTVLFDTTRVPSDLSNVDFLLFFENGKRQPEGEVLEEYLSTVPTRPISVIDDPTDAIGSATILQIVH